MKFVSFKRSTISKSECKTSVQAKHNNRHNWGETAKQKTHIILSPITFPFTLFMLQLKQ